MYFDCVTVFKVPYLRTSVKSAAQTCCVNVATTEAIMYHVSAPPLTKVKRYSALNTVDFYMGLAYIKKGGSSKSRSVHDTILLCEGSTGLLHCIHHPNTCSFIFNFSVDV